MWLEEFKSDENSKIERGFKVELEENWNVDWKLGYERTDLISLMKWKIRIQFNHFCPEFKSNLEANPIWETESICKHVYPGLKPSKWKYKAKSNLDDISKARFKSNSKTNPNSNVNWIRNSNNLIRRIWRKIIYLCYLICWENCCYLINRIYESLLWKFTFLILAREKNRIWFAKFMR